MLIPSAMIGCIVVFKATDSESIRHVVLPILTVLDQTISNHFVVLFSWLWNRSVPASAHEHNSVFIHMTEHPNSAGYFVVFIWEMSLLTIGSRVHPLPIVSVLGFPKIHSDRLRITIVKLEKLNNIPVNNEVQELHFSMIQGNSSI